MTDVELVNADGVTVFQGTLVGGGGSQPVTRCKYGSPDPVTIASLDFAYMPWAQGAGTALLDLTDPALPTIITAGTYAFGLQLSPDTDFADGGFFRAQLELDVSGGDNAVDVRVNATAGDVSAGDFPIAVLPKTWYLPAGAEVRLSIVNFDVSEQDFEIESNSTIQRLS